MAKFKTREERFSLAQQVTNLRETKDLTVEQACKKVGISPYNYANWKSLPANEPAGATALPPSRTPLNELTTVGLPMKGTTDLMFIGFGRSKDVLSAIDNLSSIFKDQIREA